MQVQRRILFGLCVLVLSACGLKTPTVTPQSITEPNPVPPRLDGGGIEADLPCVAEIKKRALRAESVADDIFLDPTEDLISNRSEADVSALPVEGTQYTRVITNTPEAWGITTGSRDIVVALVDSGMEIKHPDLKNNVWVNEAELNGKPGVDDDGNGYVDDVNGWDFTRNSPNVIDEGGHGTHCAGNIGAEKNGFGVVGVTPNVKIMPLRFIGKSGGGSTDNAILAIDYAIRLGARVISNSWGGSTYNACLEKVIKRATDKGIYFVASAGNSDRNTDKTPSYPANYPGVIAVGSSDSKDQKSSFSNYGKKGVMVFAPGQASLSTHLNASYKELSGTSMSAPQVAGQIALGLSIRDKLSVDEVKNVLCASSDPVLKTYSRCGRINVGRFLEKLQAL